MTSTKENSFHLNSSYENINKISNFNYINNINLQNKIKRFINDEFSKNNNIPSPLNIKVNKLPLIKINVDKQKSYRSSIEYNINYNVNDNELYRIKSIHSLKKLTKGNKEFDHNVSYKTDNEYSNRESNFKDIKSHRDYYMNNSLLSPIRNRKKIINKKALIGQKLNVISKNIQNANEVIHNPNEFYMNFFNNILQKESFINNEGDDVKSKRNNQLLNVLNGFTSPKDNLKKAQKNFQMNLNKMNLKYLIEKMNDISDLL